MNRRNLLLATATLSSGCGSTPYREERISRLLAGDVRTHMIVSAHPSEQSAERFRKDWIARPFENWGEFYRDSTETRELPRNLALMPGTYTHHHTTIGAAAEKREYLVGTFRREKIAIVVRIIGDHESLMLTIAEHIADTQVPTVFEILWNPTHLRAFMPDSSQLGTSVEDSDAYWP